MDGCERCGNHTSSYNECGIGPIPIGVIGSPETGHTILGFMTRVSKVLEFVQHEI